MVVDGMAEVGNQAESLVEKVVVDSLDTPVVVVVGIAGGMENWIDVAVERVEERLVHLEILLLENLQKLMALSEIHQERVAGIRPVVDLDYLW